MLLLSARVGALLRSRACARPVVAHFSTPAVGVAAETEPGFVTERDRLKWTRKPSKALIVKKIGSEVADDMAAQVASFLHAQGVQPFMDEKDIFIGPQRQTVPHCEAFNFRRAAENDEPKPDFDFTVCLGGDGTLLHYGSLYTSEVEAIPPVITLGLGTLGFMSSMDPQGWESWIQHVLDADGLVDPEAPASRLEVFCTNKARLRCQMVQKDDGHERVWLASQLGRDWHPDEVFYCMNEFILDRGSEMSLNRLGVTIDGVEVTTVEADGLIVSTPSGSTGYNLSAGGSIVAPNVPCMLVTPIAPHTLSFRPVVIHLDVAIEVDVLPTARIDARALFDCRSARRVQRGDRVLISRSKKSLPVLSFQRPDDEWFQSITNKLGWNSRGNGKCNGNGTQA